MQIFVQGDSGNGLSGQGTVTDAAFDVMGRPDWVVVQDTWKRDKITFKSMMFASDFDNFDAIRKNMRILLLQAEDGRQWYVVSEGRNFTRVNSSQEFNLLDLTFTEVARP